MAEKHNHNNKLITNNLNPNKTARPAPPPAPKKTTNNVGGK